MTKKRAKEIAREVVEQVFVNAEDQADAAPELLGEYQEDEEGEPVEVEVTSKKDHAIIAVDGTKFRVNYTVKEIK